jgi:hypothetical protein
MVALRSRRLERLFGARLEQVTHAQVADFVTNAVAESYDLDFKGELYGRSDKERRDLAGDVAALANTTGGVIVLGIEEDDQARDGFPRSEAAAPTRHHGFLATTSRYPTSMATVPSVAWLNWSTS